MMEEVGNIAFRHPPRPRSFISSVVPSTCFRPQPKQEYQPIGTKLPGKGLRSLASSRIHVKHTSYVSGLVVWIVVTVLYSKCLSATDAKDIKAENSAANQLDIRRCLSGSSSEAKMGHSQLNRPAQLIEGLSEANQLWVFGYGSLVWKTGFSYTTRKIGYIDGFVRRFWQGDTTHRGTELSPGRVATLEEDDSGRVWGVAFELLGQEQIKTALEHLGLRECVHGGYDAHFEPFTIHGTQPEILQTLVFTARPGNKNYLGRASTRDLADQILTSRGHAGHNVEYVTRLAEFMRHHVPAGMVDEHLTELDGHLRKELAERNISLESLLGMSSSSYAYMYQPQVDATGIKVSKDSQYTKDTTKTDTEGQQNKNTAQDQRRALQRYSCVPSKEGLVYKSHPEAGKTVVHRSNRSELRKHRKFFKRSMVRGGNWFTNRPHSSSIISI